MAKILFLAHRYPYPPNKGDKIRAFHIAEHLRARHLVSLGFVSTPGDSQPDLAWAQKFASFYGGNVSQAMRILRAGVAVASGTPVSVATFFDAGLAAWVRRYLATESPDVVFVFSSAMAQYVPSRLPPHTRLIIDFCDVDSEKWRQYADKMGPASAWFFAMEGRRLLAFDRMQAARAKASLFVSEDEKQVFDRLSPETLDQHLAVPNGVDVTYFDPSAVSARTTSPQTIVFVGMMDYWPNVDAVTWFAKDILPLVRQRHPGALFQIVGARPVAAVNALASNPGIEVTGAVADVRPYVKAAAVVVAPLRVARGIQNKVLEGMAMARPVVTTADALEGINAVNMRDVLAGQSPAEIASAVISVLEGRAPPSLGSAARAFVISRHEWAANLKRLDELIPE